METLKKGSKGESVKQLQKALGLTADGVFGSGTEAAVKAFQQSHGLTDDGVVGNWTWAAIMGGTKQSEEPTIIKMPLKVHVTKKVGRPIKYLVIHYTAGSSSKQGKAKAEYNAFTSRAASADFAVDDADIVQFNHDLKNYYCWAVGDKARTTEGGASLVGKASNSNCISIEVCSSLKSGWSYKYANHEGWYFTDAALENARKLARMLMQKYSIPISNVIRHYDVSGKLCPAIVGWNDGNLYDNNGKRTATKNNSQEWEKFKASLVS